MKKVMAVIMLLAVLVIPTLADEFPQTHWADPSTGYHAPMMEGTATAPVAAAPADTNVLSDPFGFLGSLTNIGLTIGYEHGIAGQHVKNGAFALLLYNFNENIGAGIGVDWFGSFQQVSATVQLQIPVAPLAMFGVTNKFLVPWVSQAIGAPIAGTTTVSATAITAAGADINFGHWLGGQFFAGGGYGNRAGAGNEDGSFILANIGYKLRF